MPRGRPSCLDLRYPHLHSTEERRPQQTRRARSLRASFVVPCPGVSRPSPGTSRARCHAGEYTQRCTSHAKHALQVHHGFRHHSPDPCRPTTASEPCLYPRRRVCTFNSSRRRHGPLCAGIDSNRLHLIGRWCSDEMFRYLHVQAQPVMNGLAAAMLRGGDYCLTPG